MPSVFHAHFLLMMRCDRLSGDDVARLGAIFDANPELGLVWGLVQRFHVIFCMAYGFAKRANYEARVLLVCSGHPPPVT